MQEFKVNFKIDCTTEDKAMFRLRAAAAKTRESVSGTYAARGLRPINEYNAKFQQRDAESIDMMTGCPKMMMSLDCLIGEKDVEATIERDEFETTAAPLVAQAVSARVVVVDMTQLNFVQVAVLQDLFTQCSLKAKDVESIQLVGSVTRMPSLCRAIKVPAPQA